MRSDGRRYDRQGGPGRRRRRIPANCALGCLRRRLCATSIDRSCGPGRGQRLNSPLKFPPRPNQALVWSSVFTLDLLRAGAKADRGTIGAASAARRGMGAIRKRPFFQRAKRRMRQPALAEIQRQLVKWLRMPGSDD